jgi:beta-glucosidase-like glycosyl hydrolase
LYQIRECGVGGIIFFQGQPLNQVYLTNYFQQESELPLLIGIDGEWGPAMRLTGMEKYPFQMTLGATFSTHLAYETGKSMVKQCKRLGIHINFAPSIDVNAEPNNPIIGFRSFGSDPHNVAKMGSALASGLQSEGVLASAKHFPGHGDTKTDSHKDLPVVTKSLSALLRDDLAPFEKLISDRVASIMVAHLKVLCIDSTSALPSSISPTYVSQWLRHDLRYQGLIITDALNMKGVAKVGSPADVALLALKAGNDIILFPEDVVGFLDSAEKSRAKGEIDSAEISERVIRLLATKYDLGLFANRFVDPVNLESDLLNIKGEYNDIYAQQIADESIIYCRIKPKDSSTLSESPRFLTSGLQSDTLILVVIGDSIPKELIPHIQQYRNGQILSIRLPWNATKDQIDSSLYAFQSSQHLYIGLDWPTWGNKSRGIPSPWQSALCNSKNGFYIHFGHQYGIQTLINTTCKTPIVLAHEYNKRSLRAAVRMSFGLSHHYGAKNSGLSQLQDENLLSYRPNRLIHSLDHSSNDGNSSKIGR